MAKSIVSHCLALRIEFSLVEESFYYHGRLCMMILVPIHSDDKP